MIQENFNTFFYEPIYNALAFIVGITPGGDVGVAIILLTVLIKMILLPLSLSAARTQVMMRFLDPKIRALQKELKEKPQELAKEMMQLFKTHKVNPFASIFLIIIQIPIIIGLYFVFLHEGSGAGFDPNLLYSFVPFPEHASFTFLGYIDLVGRSVLLAVLVGISQYYVAKLTMVAPPPSEAGSSLKDDFMRSLHLQMRYVFPVVMAVVAYVISSAVALYFLVSNLFMIAQELYVRHAHKEKNV